MEVQRRFSVADNSATYMADCLISEKLGCAPEVIMRFGSSGISFSALESIKEKVGSYMVERSENICKRFAAGIFDEPVEVEEYAPKFFRVRKSI